jgi:hypothetical protein
MYLKVNAEWQAGTTFGLMASFSTAVTLSLILGTGRFAMVMGFLKPFTPLERNHVTFPCTSGACCRE